MAKKETTMHEIVEYDVDKAVIAEWKQKYTGMKITDAKSDKAVRAARTFMVSQRTAVDKWRIDKNEDANEWRRKVNQIAKEITALLLPIEEPLQVECKRVDDEREAKRAEKARIEEERKDEIRSRIDEILGMLIGLPTMPLTDLRKLSDKLEKIEITDDFMEFKNEATEALDAAYNTVQDAITARIKLDKEDADRQAEDARLEKIRKEQEAAQAKIDEEHKKIIEEKYKIDAAKQADIDRKEREEWEKDEKARILLELEKKKAAAEEEQAQKAEMAPDKEKLIKWIVLMNKPAPQLKSKKAQEIARIAFEQIELILQDAEDKAQKL